MTANGRDVRVVYTKYDGSLHWHYTMRYLGEDEHGTWLGAPPGLVARRGHQHQVVIREAHVLLFPRGAREAWWTAIFNAAPARTEIYCDIATPARWPDPGQVTMVDVLDRLLQPDGDEQTENDGCDVNEELFPAIGGVVCGVYIEQGRMLLGNGGHRWLGFLISNRPGVGN